MPKTKKSKTSGYKLISLCAGALVLGCALPIAAVLAHTGTSTTDQAIMEIIGGSALVYVFGVYLLKL